MWLTKTYNYFHYAGLTREQYRQIQPNLKSENIKILTRMSGITMTLFLFMIMGHVIEGTIPCVLGLYIIGAVVHAVVHMICIFGHETYVTRYLYHFFLSSLYVMGILIDIKTRTTQSVVSFVILLVICQLIFNERPILTFSIALLAGTLFLFVEVEGTAPSRISLGREDALSVAACLTAGLALNLLLASSRARTHMVMQEHKTQKEQMEKALQVADVAAASKAAFLFNMSHDIRTPMNAILGYTDLLMKGQNLTQKQKEQLGKIRMSSDYLLDLLDNVLEMSRIENGKLTLDESPCSAITFNDSLFTVFEEDMRKKNLHFTRSIRIDHYYVYCDQLKLRELFLNILSNSVKYTPEGGSIQLILEEVPLTEAGLDMLNEEEYACFKTSIVDTGIGMSKEFLPHIFESFSRERTATESQVVGSGLGMGIVKNLVDMMNGVIRIDSEPGKGTTTTLWLPHRIASMEDLPGTNVLETETNETGTPRDLEGRRVLLAEDNELNAEIATEILEEFGVKVTRAKDGVVCVDVMEKAAPDTYDLILMDIQMPNMDGYRAAAMIRHLKDPRKAGIPIVAMTANALEKDKADAVNAGMNDHLAKPIDIKKLYATLKKHIGGSAAG